MKRFFCILAIISILFCGISVNAEQDYFTFSVAPADGKQAVISENGKISLVFSLTATGKTFGKDFTIEEINYRDSSISKKAVFDAPDANLTKANGNSVSFNATDVPLSKDNSGKTVDFELVWKDSNGQHTSKASLQIAVPAPKLSISASVDSKTVLQGQKIDITYTVKNTGNVPVSNITIFDDAISKALNRENIYAMGKEYSINAGIEFSHSVSVSLTQSTTLAPSVTYKYDGQLYTEKGATLNLIAEEQIPTLSLSASSYSVSELNDSVTFNYTIKNTTNVELNNIKIFNGDSDDSTIVYSKESLAVNGELSGSFSLNITKSAFYKVKVLYSFDGSDGEKEISAKTEKMVRLPGEVKLSVASITPQTITSPGTLDFKLRVENSATLPIKDVYISEINNLADKTLVSAQIAGATNNTATSFDKDITVKIPADNTTVSFVLSYVLDDEECAVKLDYPIVFDTELATATPAATEVPTISQAPIEITESNSANQSNEILWIILGALVLLLVGCMIVFLFVLKGNINSLLPMKPVKRFTDEIFDASDDGTLFDSSDDSEEDEDIKIFEKNSDNSNNTDFNDAFEKEDNDEDSHIKLFEHSEN